MFDCIAEEDKSDFYDVFKMNGTFLTYSMGMTIKNW